jgi:hypothetical protein
VSATLSLVEVLQKSEQERKMQREILKFGGRKQLLMGALLLIGLAAALAAQSESRPPMTQIREFYTDYNFVCCLSTKAERARLAGYLDQDSLPEDIDSLRHNAVFQRMKRIQGRIFVVDPEMAKAPGEPWKRLEYVFRADRYGVKEIRRIPEGAAVDVEVLTLKPEEILRFIKSYDAAAKADETLPEAAFKSTPNQDAVITKEVHVWHPRQGRWMKLDSHYTFLKDKK